MNRKKVKLILLIAGILIFAAGIALFIINIIGIISQGTHGSRGLINNVFAFNIIAVISIVPLSIVSLMHSKDIRETKRGLSGFLKGLAYFWIISGAVNTSGLILVNIFFIK